jgi:hypothetical protein
MTQKNKGFVLAALLVVLAVTYFYMRGGSSFSGPVTADTKFERLNVQDPALRVYELDQVRKAEYKGSEHNIFAYGPPPPSPAVLAAKAEAERQAHVVGPRPKPPDPPLVVPATFFGYATNPRTKNRLGFFSTPDDVFIVGEGGMLLNRYRLTRIGNVSADFEEVSSGKHATLQMTQPAEEGTAQPGQPQPPPQPPQSQ